MTAKLTDLMEHVLKTLRLFGHLQSTELARVLGVLPPIAGRACHRLEEQGYVLGRANALGSTSWVLSAKGARYLGLRGLDCGHGRDLNVQALSLGHKVLGDNYVIEQLLAGAEAHTEHALTSGLVPGVTAEQLMQHYGKRPDALVFRDSAVPGIRHVDWVEVENAYKSDAERSKVISLGWALGDYLAGNSGLVLERLIIAYDAAENHAAVMTKQFIKHLRDHRVEDPQSISDAIVLVELNVERPFVYRGLGRARPLSELLVYPGTQAA